MSEDDLKRNLTVNVATATCFYEIFVGVAEDFGIDIEEDEVLRYYVESVHEFFHNNLGAYPWMIRDVFLKYQAELVNTDYKPFFNAVTDNMLNVFDVIRDKYIELDGEEYPPVVKLNIQVINTDKPVDYSNL